MSWLDIINNHEILLAFQEGSLWNSSANATDYTTGMVERDTGRITWKISKDF